MKIFSDYIDSRLFFKKLRKFTTEEKGLIDNIFNLILRNDKKSEITESEEIEIFNNNDFITDIISKSFVVNKQSMYLEFYKHYCYEKEYFTRLLIDVRDPDGKDMFPTSADRYANKKEQKLKHLIYITCKGSMDLRNDPNQPYYRPILFNVKFSRDIDWTERENNMMGISIDYDENDYLLSDSKKKFKKFGKKVNESILKAIKPKNKSIYYSKRK